MDTIDKKQAIRISNVVARGSPLRETRRVRRPVSSANKCQPSRIKRRVVASKVTK